MSYYSALFDSILHALVNHELDQLAVQQAEQVVGDLQAPQHTWEEALQEFLDEENNEVQKTLKKQWRGSVVCAVTSSVIGVMRLTLGFGDPDPGDRLAASRAIYGELSAQIAACVPDGGWQGSAAQAYVTQNRAQSQRAKLMETLDHVAGELVSAQALAVINTRTCLNIEFFTVLAVAASCLALEQFGGPTGQQASLAVAVVVCPIALGVATDKLISLGRMTSQNVSNLQGLTRRLTTMLTALPPPYAAISSLPDAPHPVPGLPDDTTAIPKTPDICLALADLPGAPEFSVSALPTPGFPDFGDTDLPIPPLAVAPSLPNSLPGGSPTMLAASELAALPDFSGDLAALPTLAQLTTSLHQLTGISGVAGGLSQLTTMAGQQAQMISVAQQGAQQHTNLGNGVNQDDDVPRADGGTTTGQHAPVETASIASQQGQRRVL